MDAFDADVLIYAATKDPRGRLVRGLMDRDPAGIGSVLLLPEVLTRLLRLGQPSEIRALEWMLTRLDLKPVDSSTARLAATLGSKYKLRAVDAVHLATAVGTGADRFITNNARDFPVSISEIDVTYPDMLEP